MTDREISYIAGFFDGEGCTSVMKRLERRSYGVYWSYAIYVRVANTNFEVLEWMQTLCGGAIYDHTKKIDRGNRQESRVWHLQGKHAQAFLEMIEPFVIVKRQQISLALKFLRMGNKTAPLARAEMYARMKELNFRGIRNKTAVGSAPVTSDLMQEVLLDFPETQ